MSDWKPDKYLEFKSERTQPSIDLVSKINQVNPKTIIDIGCGPGNSTQVLANRWADAKITGIDSSNAMIEKARQEFPNQQWIEADASTYKSSEKFDIVFSNAVIQWIPDHEALLAKLKRLLTDNGTLAVQIPLFWDMPLGKILDSVGRDNRWREKTVGVSDLLIIQNYSFYYDVLSNLFNTVKMWVTDYLHVMDNHLSIIEMMRSTGLKPYSERLADEANMNAFEAMVIENMKKPYPVQKNGKVLLPFKRLFFTGCNL